MKNGKIELLRFGLCMAVLLYHLNLEYFDGGFLIGEAFSFFGHGRSGVEFFFIVSGYLMARTAHKLQGNGVPVGKSSVQFMGRKLKRLLPAHLVAVLVMAVYIAVNYARPVEGLMVRLSSVLFLQRTGIGETAFVGVEWYVSSMLIAMAVLFPLLKANYDVTARAVAPIGSLLIMGYLVQTYGALPNSGVMDSFTFNGNLRAVGVMLLGVCTYEASQLLRNRGIIKRFSAELIVLEALCYLAYGYYLVSQLESSYDALAALFCAVAVTITFSRDNLRLYNNKLFYWLGEISFPVYLSQNFARKLVIGYLPEDTRAYVKILVCTALCLAVGIATHYAAKLLTVLFSRYVRQRGRAAA